VEITAKKESGKQKGKKAVLAMQGLYGELYTVKEPGERNYPKNLDGPQGPPLIKKQIQSRGKTQQQPTRGGGGFRKNRKIF